ncbi:MAG: hypothetical protein ACREMW_06660, partial [Gemmatimonadales bacterium]
MMRNLRAAWTEDPSYLPAIGEVVWVHSDLQSYVPPHIAAEIDSLAAHADPVFGACIRGLLRLDSAWTALVVPPHGFGAANLCAANHRLGRHPRRREEQERVTLARALWQRYPDTDRYAATLSGALRQAEAWQEIEVVASEMSDPRRHPFVRLEGYQLHLDMLHHLGRHEEAGSL